MSYSIGGGGGPAASFSENTEHALSKPYELEWPPSPDFVQQLNEMLEQLFKSITKSAADIDVVETNVAAIASDARLVTLALTEAQLEAINTTPVRLVAAPGVGKVIIPLWHNIRLDVTTGYSTSPTFNLVYAGQTTGLCTALNPSWGSAAVQYQSQSGVSISYTESTFDPRNVAVNIRGSADPGTPGTGVATAIYEALYYIADYS